MKCFTLTFSSNLTFDPSIKVSRSNAYYFAVGSEKLVVADSAVVTLKNYSNTYSAIQNVALRTQAGRTVFAAATSYSADEKDALALLTITKKTWSKVELSVLGLDETQKIAESPDHTVLLFVWRAGQELTFRQVGEEQVSRNVRRPRKHLGIFTGTDTVHEMQPREDIQIFRYDGNTFTGYTPQQRVDVVMPAAPADPELAQIELSFRLAQFAENRVASLNHTLSLLEALAPKAIITANIREAFVNHIATVSDAFIEAGDLAQAERALKLGLHTLYACTEGLNIGITRKLFAEHLVQVQTVRRQQNAQRSEQKLEE